jgi:17beta-estradiol 17-dehydrogenase / very-long-chain 3-oxoacyl-CoA reductase
LVLFKIQNQFKHAFRSLILFMLQKLLALGGVVAATKVAIEVGSWVYINLIYRADFVKLGAKRGAYAVITGASDGIGRGLAEEGAELGFNLVLVARRKDLLDEIARNLASKFGVDVRVLSIDCGDPHACSKIADFCRDLEISVLFNNVGLANPEPMSLENHGSELITRIVTLNALFLTNLTATFLPILRKRTANDPSSTAVIANVSSFLSILPACYYSVYAGTKAYVNRFSDALRAELHGSGVAVTTLRPAHVVTAMSGLSVPSLMAPTPRAFARAAWAKLGCPGAAVSPHLPHALQEALAASMPTWLLAHSLRAALAPMPKPQ